MMVRPPEAAPTGPADGGRITPRVGPRRPRGPQDSLSYLAIWVHTVVRGTVWAHKRLSAFSCGPWVWAFYACVVSSRGPTDKTGPVLGPRAGPFQCFQCLFIA